MYKHFVYSSVVEHFGGFYLLAVGNNAAVNVDVQISVQIFVSQGLRMLGSCSVLSLTLELVEAFAFKLPHLLWVFLLITAPPHSRCFDFNYLWSLEILLFYRAQQCYKNC